jgi:glycosyltransferase involved in cell wall biosynthesis
MPYPTLTQAEGGYPDVDSREPEGLGTVHAASFPGGIDRDPGPSGLAYLINQYPMTSLVFIRRELVALEATGIAVRRYALRETREPLVDEADQAERRKTRAVLDAGALGLAGALLKTALLRPGAWLRGLRLALRAGWRSERGVLVNLVYFCEACVLLRWCRDDGIRHVHAHFATNSASVAMLCRELGGPPYSITLHGPEEFDKPEALALDEKVARATFAAVISEFSRSQLYRWVAYRDWAKIRVVRCGLDASFFNGAPVPPASGRQLICVGRLAEQKGQLILIEAARLLAERTADFTLVLIGDGPMRGEIEALIDRFGLGSRVTLLGRQNNAEVRRQILASRALVLPSFAEGLPVVLMEALALERPVISTYVAGIPELVEDRVSGWLVTPGSVEGLARAMGEALAAPEEQLRAMGRAGAARASAMHKIEDSVAALAELFRATNRATDPGRHGRAESRP